MIRIKELKGRTAIRLALAFSFFFVLAVALLFALIYFSLTQSLETGIRDRVIQARDALTSVDRDQGFSDLGHVVASEAASVRNADSIFLLVDEHGQRVAGNIYAARRFSGWRLLDRAQFPAIRDAGLRDDRFFAIWTPVSKGALLVGGNNRAITQTSQTLLNALIWALALSIVVPVLLGAHLAIRAQRKIDALSSTLTAVAAGQVARRVPVAEASDDLDHAAIQINHTLDQLQRLIQNVNQTSSDIAHDLKTPIGRVRQKLDRALVSAQGDPDFRCVISQVLQEIDTIVETFEALLRITQIEAGMGRNRFLPLDLNELLRNIAEVYGAVIEDEGYRFEAAIETAQPVIVRGDRELLTQLVANLIENSIRHCPKGTLISLSLTETDGWVIVRLADTGPGIPEAEREKVFQRLYRLEKSRSTPGSGLGLSLIAAIAQLHGAKIDLSDNKPGLCVRIRLPRFYVSEAKILARI